MSALGIGAARGLSCCCAGCFLRLPLRPGVELGTGPCSISSALSRGPGSPRVSPGARPPPPPLACTQPGPGSERRRCFGLLLPQLSARPGPARPAPTPAAGPAPPAPRCSGAARRTAPVQAGARPTWGGGSAPRQRHVSWPRPSTVNGCQENKRGGQQPPPPSPPPCVVTGAPARGGGGEGSRGAALLKAAAAALRPLESGSADAADNSPAGGAGREERGRHLRAQLRPAPPPRST